MKRKQKVVSIFAAHYAAFQSPWSHDSLPQELTYKELDGAVAGSADLVTFDYIAENPDIVVETFQCPENEVASQVQAGLGYYSAGVTELLTVGLQSTATAGHSSGQLAVTTAEIAHQQGGEGDQGVLIENHSSEMYEYFQSQDGSYFSYDGVEQGGNQACHDADAVDDGSTELVEAQWEQWNQQEPELGGETRETVAATKQDESSERKDSDSRELEFDEGYEPDRYYPGQARTSNSAAVSGDEYAEGGGVEAQSDAAGGQGGSDSLDGIVREAGHSQSPLTGAASYGFETF